MHSPKTKTVKRWGSWLSPSPSVEAGAASDFLSEGVCSRDINIALLSDDVRHGGRKNSVELCEDVVRSNIHQCSRPGLRCELFEVSHPAECFPWAVSEAECRECREGFDVVASSGCGGGSG